MALAGLLTRLALPVALGLRAWSPMCPAEQQPAPDAFKTLRERMVAEQIAARGVRDPRVLRAMREVPRHLFVPVGDEHAAYADEPRQIGYGQTISQPYIVALMTELARPQPTDRALEVGTGSGYQAAVLSKLVAAVYTIEFTKALAIDAQRRLADLHCANVIAKSGDGYGGWPDRSPFDLIIVTAAPERVPPALIDQLKPGGRLVIPVGAVEDVQELQLIEKDDTGAARVEHVTSVRFVPLRRRGPFDPFAPDS